MNRKTPVTATGKCCRLVAVSVNFGGDRRFTGSKVNTGREARDPAAGQAEPEIFRTVFELDPV